MLSLEIPNKGVGDDRSCQKNCYQSQETRYLVFPNQGTFIWAFCAFMQFCTSLAFDLSVPATLPWQEAPWLVQKTLAWLMRASPTPKPQIFQGFWAYLCTALSFVGCSCCSFNLERSVFWRIARCLLIGEQRCLHRSKLGGTDASEVNSGANLTRRV